MNYLILFIQIVFWLFAGIESDLPAASDNVRAGDVKFTKHFNDSIFKVTEKGYFSVEILTGQKELKMLGMNSTGIIIHDNEDEDVEDAEILVESRILTSGRENTQKMPVTEKGAGLYVLDSAVTETGGLLELKVTLRKDGRDDMAVFAFPDSLRQSLKAGKYDASYLKAIEKKIPVDTSAVRLSKKGVFRVGYSCESGMVPLVRIHNWKIRVATADGRPVSGAEIALEGRMSEHGHNLPSKPAVTKDLGNGFYIVEGMKFNMTGLWEVTFSIKTKDETDSVVFNVPVE